MDKQTLSNYGWIVICILVLSVMIAFATPFGSFIGDGFKSVYTGLYDTSNNAQNIVLSNLGGAPTLEELQEQYTFTYYTSLTKAINDINNASIGASADANKDTATAGIYQNGNKIIAVLLKDSTEAGKIETKADMTINLGGHTLSAPLLAISVIQGNLTIDGRMKGSKIEINVEGNARCVQVGENTSCTILGGEYSVSNNITNNTALITNAGTLSIQNAKLEANCVGGALGIQTLNTAQKTSIASSDITVESQDIVWGINCATGALEISSCNIATHSTKMGAAGIVCTPNVALTVKNTKITALSDEGGYHVSGMNLQSDTNIIEGCTIKAFSNGPANGIDNGGTIKLKNCNISAKSTGISSIANLYIDGGTYEGSTHGGIQIAGEGATGYIKNATIRDCVIPDGYTEAGTTGGIALRIEGSSDSVNMHVVMNNCTIQGARYTLFMRSPHGETGNKLYISNSSIDTDKVLGIDNPANTIYIGKGNNFTAANAFNPAAVVETDEEYSVDF